MSRLPRREVLIALLVAVLGAGLYVTRRGSSSNGASPAAQGSAAAAGQGAATGPVAALHLDRLNAGDEDLGRVSRNPFRFQERAAPAAARRASQSTFVAPPAPTGPPPPPPITLRYIGLIEAPPRAGRVALLSDGRGGLMSGREGDTIEGRYRMLRVGTDSIEMAYLDGRGRQTIRLSGQ